MAIRTQKLYAWFTYIAHQKSHMLSLAFPYQIETSCHLQFSAPMELPWQGQLHSFLTKSI